MRVTVRHRRDAGNDAESRSGYGMRNRRRKGSRTRVRMRLLPGLHFDLQRNRSPAHKPSDPRTAELHIVKQLIEQIAAEAPADVELFPQESFINVAKPMT